MPLYTCVLWVALGLPLIQKWPRYTTNCYNFRILVIVFDIPTAATSISPVLRYVSAPIISNTDCTKAYSIIQPSNICMSGAGGKSSCSVRISLRFLELIKDLYFFA